MLVPVALAGAAHQHILDSSEYSLPCNGNDLLPVRPNVKPASLVGFAESATRHIHGRIAPVQIARELIYRATVPPYLSGEIFVGLRRLGKETVLALYEGEDHWEGNWSYSNQLDYSQRILNWFDTHLSRNVAK